MNDKEVQVAYHVGQSGELHGIRRTDESRSGVLRHSNDGNLYDKTQGRRPPHAPTSSDKNTTKKWGKHILIKLF